MFSRIGRAILKMLSRRRNDGGAWSTRDEDEQIDDPLTLRRWDAAKTDRLNRAHWENATGQPINVDLNSHLKTLRARCCHEAFSNPMVEGVIKTHSVDLLGPNGPKLQVVSDNEAYNRALEEVWSNWWERPEITGQLSGVDLLYQWNWSMWTKGPILVQFIEDDQFTTDQTVATKLMNLDPDRLGTPPDQAGDPNVALGVRRDSRGRPTQYYVSKLDEFGPFFVLSPEFDEIPADDILHAFEQLEPGQVTGYPRLSSCLQEIADLKDYDEQVLDAARAAADNGVLLQTLVPEALDDFKVVNNSMPMERRQIRTLPPGYQPVQLDPRQPAAHYVDYRHEKLRSLGRPVHMPLLLILLSAEESNFSQSRIDVNVFYERGLKFQRRWWEHNMLNRLVQLVEREASLATRGGKFVLPKKPEKVSYRWGWTPLPQADEQKHLDAIERRLRIGESSYAEILGESGKDEDTMIANRKRTNEKLEEAGLPPIGAGDSNNSSEAIEPGDDKPPVKPEKKRRKATEQNNV